MKESVFPWFQHRGCTSSWWPRHSFPQITVGLSPTTNSRAGVKYPRVSPGVSLAMDYPNEVNPEHHEKADCPGLLSKLFKKNREWLLSQVGTCDFLKQWGI